jgi:SNF2 family DNA or RNA helicase
VVKTEKKRFKIYLRTREVGMILDESTKIKNPNSQLTKAFFEISPLLKKRIIMTGTPSDNRPYDIWAQIWFLDQGRSLGKNFDKFRASVDLSKELFADLEARSQYSANLEAIWPKLSSFAVRETKDSGIIVLPHKRIESVATEWEQRQHAIYLQVQEEEKAYVIRDGVPTEDRSDEILKRLLRLVQIASNPILVDEGYTSVPGKFPYLYDLITRVAGAGEKCIVWSSFVKNVNWLANELSEFRPCKVHGKMSMDRREDSLDDFMEDADRKVLIATPGAAKEGLTLTVANTVIFFDRSFSLSDYTQAQARIHRISQEKECFVYNLVMTDSIDEYVDLLLESKELAARLAQGDISRPYFDARMRYDFGKVIGQILGMRS